MYSYVQHGFDLAFMLRKTLDLIFLEGCFVLVLGFEESIPILDSYVQHGFEVAFILKKSLTLLFSPSKRNYIPILDSYVHFFDLALKWGVDLRLLEE